MHEANASDRNALTSRGEIDRPEVQNACSTQAPELTDAQFSTYGREGQRPCRECKSSESPSGEGLRDDDPTPYTSC